MINSLNIEQTDYEEDIYLLYSSEKVELQTKTKVNKTPSMGIATDYYIFKRSSCCFPIANEAWDQVKKSRSLAWPDLPNYWGWSRKVCRGKV